MQDLTSLGIWNALNVIFITLLSVFGAFDILLAAILILLELRPSFWGTWPRLRAVLHAFSVGLIVLLLSVVMLLFAFGVLLTVGRLIIAKVRSTCENLFGDLKVPSNCF